jgi:hypothetical protein
MPSTLAPTAPGDAPAPTATGEAAAAPAASTPSLCTAAAIGTVLAAAACLTGCRGAGSSTFVVVPDTRDTVRENALRIDEQGLRLEYASDIDRVVYLGPIDGPNLLHTASLDQEPNADGGYTFFGGMYTWVSPQGGPNGWRDFAGEPSPWPPDPALDRGPASFTARTDESFTARSPADRAGLRQQTSIEITGPGRAEMHYRIVNTSEGTLARGTWVNTAVPPNAIIAVRALEPAPLVSEPVMLGGAEAEAGAETTPDAAEPTRVAEADLGGAAAAGAMAGDAGEVAEAIEQADAAVRAQRAAALRPRVWAWNGESPDPLIDIMEGPDANGWFLIDLTRAEWQGGTKFYLDAPTTIAVWVPEKKNRESGYWFVREQAVPVDSARLIENGEGPVAFYIDPGSELIEAELYGPITDIEPGAAAQTRERWSVHPAATPSTSFINENNPLPVAR